MNTKKSCELCDGFARMHCESDRASLCWSCDFKVHSANFLVARHSRTLLCHVCQSPTPWTAAGSKIGHTVSVCDGCVCNYDKFSRKDESRSENYDEGNETEVDSGTLEDEEFESDDEDDEDDENEEEYEDIDDEDIQVVPWSPSAPPPASASTSSLNGEEESSSSSSQRRRIEPHRKRTREKCTDLRLNANNDCTNSQENKNAPPCVAVDGGESGGERGVGSVTCVDSLPPPLGEKQSKRRRRVTERVGLSESRSWTIIESVKRWHRHEIKSSAGIAKICSLSEDPSVVDYESSESS